ICSNRARLADTAYASRRKTGCARWTGSQVSAVAIRVLRPGRQIEREPRVSVALHPRYGELDRVGALIMTNRTVAVIGGGTWGTALSQVLADNGHGVRVWDVNADVLAKMRATRRHPKLLDVELPA